MFSKKLREAAERVAQQQPAPAPAVYPVTTTAQGETIWADANGNITSAPGQVAPGAGFTPTQTGISVPDYLGNIIKESAAPAGGRFDAMSGGGNAAEWWGNGDMYKTPEHVYLGNRGTYVDPSDPTNTLQNSFLTPDKRALTEYWTPEVQAGRRSLLNGKPYDILDAQGNVTGQGTFEGLSDADSMDNVAIAMMTMGMGATLAGLGTAATAGGAGGAGGGGYGIVGGATEPVASLSTSGFGAGTAGAGAGGSTGFGFNGSSSILDSGANLFDPTGWANPIQSTTGQMAGNIANSAGSSTIPGFGLSPSILPPVTPPGGIDFSQVPTPPTNSPAASPAQAPAAPPAAPDGVPPPANPNVSPTSLIPGVTNGQLLGGAASLIGGLAGGQGQQSGGTTSRELPEFLQGPVANDLVPRTQGLLNSQMPAAQQAGQQQMTAGGGLLNRPVAGNGVGQVTLQTPTTAQNPYLTGMADDIGRRTRELLDENNLSITGQFAGGPGLGGSRQGVAQGVAAGKAADYLSGNLAGLYGTAWNSDANRALQKYQADQGFYGQQRGQDLSQAAVGSGLLNDGLNTQWGPLLNASRTYAPFTGFGNTTQSQESGGGWQGAVGGLLTGASLGRQMGWW